MRVTQIKIMSFGDGLSNIIFHEENIFFVDNNTVDNWTTELKKLYSDREKIYTVGKKGKSTIDKRFDLDTFYKGLEEIMRITT